LIFLGRDIPTTTIIRSLDITTNSAELSGKVGEFRWARENGKYGQENISVIIGDKNKANSFSGTIFKNDGIKKNI
jgi:hypothetical protein